MNILIYVFAPTDLKVVGATFSQALSALMISRLQLNLKQLSRPSPFATTIVARTAPTLHASPANQGKRRGAMRNNWELASIFGTGFEGNTFLSFGNLGEDMTGFTIPSNENELSESKVEMDAFELTEIPRSR